MAVEAKLLNSVYTWPMPSNPNMRSYEILCLTKIIRETFICPVARSVSTWHSRPSAISCRLRLQGVLRPAAPWLRLEAARRTAQSCLGWGARSRVNGFRCFKFCGKSCSQQQARIFSLKYCRRLVHTCSWLFRGVLKSPSFSLFPSLSWFWLFLNKDMNFILICSNKRTLGHYANDFKWSWLAAKDACSEAHELQTPIDPKQRRWPLRSESSPLAALQSSCPGSSAVPNATCVSWAQKSGGGHMKQQLKRKSKMKIKIPGPK